MLYKNTSKLSFFLDPKFAKLIVDLREYFISMVSTSLLQETKYYASSDQCRDELVKTMNELAAIEPEFIVQTAYYVRHKMYIRTCTNFILAFAILNQKTQPFVAKYFNKTVLIPGDLIEVCQFVQVINLINKGIAIEGIQDLRKKLYFPSLLRYCVASKLKEFSLYQLGKKCSDSNRKKTIR
jgi:telomerase protein component 1